MANERDKWQRAIDEAIEEAMAEGKFDNLPGRGRPLNLGDDAFEEVGMWAVNRLLQSSGFKPDWIEDQAEILRDLERARRALARSWQWRVDALARGEGYAFVTGEWDRAVSRFRETAEKLNKKIKTYNIKAPSVHVHLPVLNVEAEIRKAQDA